MKILGSKVSIKENLLFSLNKYFVLWLILLITIVFDFLTTLNFVSNLGVHAEANIVVAWLMKNFGLGPGVLIGKSLQLIPVLAFVSLSKRMGNIFLLFVVLLNLWAVFINT